MNKTQKMIKAIMYPIIIIVITLGVAGNLGEWYSGYSIVSAFDFDITWPFWVITLAIIYIIEKTIFSDKKKNKD